MSNLPITHSDALRAHGWLQEHFHDNIQATVNGTNYNAALFSAMVCQETAYRWLKWIPQTDPETVLARCVFDASGDYPGTSRSAFPRNSAEFHDKYGDEFTDMLIAEGNKMRALMGWSGAAYLYKGYGIVQYDLQAVIEDEDFFRNKLWYSIDECLKRWVKEMNSKWHGDLWLTVEHYNGSGPAAQQYAANVREFYRVITGS